MKIWILTWYENERCDLYRVWYINLNNYRGDNEVCVIDAQVNLVKC